MAKGDYELDGSFCSFFGAYAKIYTLSDETGNIFYVGCTTSPIEIRFSAHISEARMNKSGNKRKIELIRSLDYKIIITVVHMLWVTGRDAKHTFKETRPVEKEWISKFHALGYKLLNKEVKEISCAPKKHRPEFIGQAFIAKRNKDKEVEILEVKRQSGTLK